uniref:ShKT domain-containing protein n=1 Tax=Ditylenchus dipsaci TaxID=166011 RepID=A0A915DAN7_9BILA
MWVQVLRYLGALNSGQIVDESPPFPKKDAFKNADRFSPGKTNNVAIGNAPASAPFASSVLPPANQPVYSQQPGGYGQPGVYNQQQPNYNNQQPGVYNQQQPYYNNQQPGVYTQPGYVAPTTYATPNTNYGYQSPSYGPGQIVPYTNTPYGGVGTGGTQPDIQRNEKIMIRMTRTNTSFGTCISIRKLSVWHSCPPGYPTAYPQPYIQPINQQQPIYRQPTPYPTQQQQPYYPTSYSNPTILLSNNNPIIALVKYPITLTSKLLTTPTSKLIIPTSQQHLTTLLYSNNPLLPYAPTTQPNYYPGSQGPYYPSAQPYPTQQAPYGYQPAVTYAGYSNTYAVPSYSPYGVPTPTIYPVSPYGGAVVGVPVGSAVSPGTTYVNGVQTIAGVQPIAGVQTINGVQTIGGVQTIQGLQTINGVQYLNGLPVQLVPVVNGVTTNGGSTGVVTLNPATTIGSGVNAGTLINTVPVNTAPVNTGLGTAGTVGNTGSVGNTGTLGTGYNTGTANLVPNTGLAGIAASSCTDASTDCPSYKTYCSLQSIMEACMSTCNMCALSSTIALNG